MKEKLLLIDGNSIMNRAFYGIPMLTDAKGLHTNAVYGFLNIMLKVMEQENPDYMAIAFDVHAPTFRHKIYKDYKGTRKGMPDELREQMPVIKELLKAMDICIVEKEGYEADDILGTLARAGEEKGMEVALISGDRDLLQIASDNIKIRIPKTRGNKTEIEDYNTGDVLEKYGLLPSQIIELKALMGDSSDNIPGVPKIGEKTATELLKQYKDIETLKAHREEITKKSIKESLLNNFEMAELSKILATIDTKADINTDFSDKKIGDIYTERAYEIVKELGFKNILSKFENSRFETSDTFIKEKVGTKEDFDVLISELSKRESVGFRMFFDGREGLCLTICADKDRAFFIPVKNSKTEGLEGDLVKEGLLRLLKNGAAGRNGRRGFSTFGVKELFHYIPGASEPEIIKGLFDIKLALYLLDPLRSDYGIEDVAAGNGMTMKSYKELFDKKKLFEAYSEDTEEFSDYACRAALVSFCFFEDLKKRLSENGMLTLFEEIEMPLTACLYLMEKEGIRVKPEALKEYGDELYKQIVVLEDKIHKEAGEDFNINSPKQLGEILFDKMKLPGGKKTKTGYSTAADILEKLSAEYPFVKDILEYRGLSKLKSTYADGLMQFVGEEDRIHSTFHQTITATGRISSADPNLQNIPIRMEQGRLIRKVFIPREGFVFLDADYSQIELRVLAHMSGDESLINAFKEGQDIHRMTASKVFNTPFEEVTPLQRRNAKAVNFGIIYGISSFGLASDIGMSTKEAKEFIDNYFEIFPKIKDFLDSLVRSAKDKGFAETLYGRRRPVPELKESNFMRRQFGERVAMNAPVQGTAADIIKIAMIRVENRLRKEELRSKLILQIHDELLLEAAEEEKERAGRILVEEMEKAADLKVKLAVDMNEGKDWYEAK